MTAYALSSLKLPQTITLSFCFSTYLILSILNIIWIGNIVYDIKNNYVWNKVYNKAKLGQFYRIKDTYKKLSEDMKENANFIFNYATVLFNYGCYNESLFYAQKCLSLVNNYDVQLLLADNYYKLENYELAIHHYKTASLMCPNRFSPLYGMFIVYDTANDIVQAINCGRTILAKPIKVKSRILHELLFDVQEKMDSLERGTSKCSGTNKN